MRKADWENGNCHDQCFEFLGTFPQLVFGFYLGPLDMFKKGITVVNNHHVVEP